MRDVAAESGSSASTYQVLGKLATGGMAEIFLARVASAAGVERYVVLKRVLREKASDVRFVQMFLDEARLAAQLGHANIAQVYDTGKLGDSYFFTMEYVHGETVRGLLQRAQALRLAMPISAVVTIIAATAAALHHAHRKVGLDGRPLGIVHRDISPSNIMVSYDGTVKVIDFGVAKALQRASETQSGTVKGKIAYLSPEQCRGHELDRRSDLFSLGIVMWELLTGQRLFRRDSDFATMAAIVQEPVLPPSSVRAGVPAELDQAVLRMLAKRADDRFQSADDALQAIEEAGARCGAAVSTSALGRLMRDLFGQRPEPWLEMAAQQTAADGITITSEPVPLELSLGSGSSLEMQLDAIPDLRGVETVASGPIPVARATTPMRARTNDPVPTGTTAAVALQTQTEPWLAPNSYPPRAPAPAPRANRMWMLLVLIAVGAAAVTGLVAHAVSGGASRAAQDVQDARITVVIAPPPAPAADAAPVVAEVLADAPADQPDAPVEAQDTSVEAPAAPAQELSRTAPAPAPVAHPPRPVDPETLFQQGRMRELAKLCVHEPVSITHAVACTLGSCAAKDVATAKKWLSAVPPARRQTAIQSCRDKGVDVCDDPLLCQH